MGVEGGDRECLYENYLFELKKDRGTRCSGAMDEDLSIPDNSREGVMNEIESRLAASSTLGVGGPRGLKRDMGTDDDCAKRKTIEGIEIVADDVGAKATAAIEVGLTIKKNI